MIKTKNASIFLSLLFLGFVSLVASCNKAEPTKKENKDVKVEQKDAIKQTTFNPMFSYALIRGPVNKNSYLTVLNYWEDNCKIEKHKFITVFENGEIATDNILKMEIISNTVEYSNFGEDEQGDCFAKFKMPNNINSIPIIILTDVESVTNVEKANWTAVSKEKFDTSMLLNKHKFKTRLGCGYKWFIKDKKLVYGNEYTNSGFDRCDIFQSFGVLSLMCGGDNGSFFQNGAEVVCGEDAVVRDNLLAENTFWGRLTINNINMYLFFTTLSSGHSAVSEAVFTNANDPMLLYGTQVNPDQFFKTFFMNHRKSFKESKRR